MEGDLLVGVGLLTFGSGIFALMRPDGFRRVIRDWVSDQPWRIQIVGGVLCLYGIVMLWASFPLRSNRDFVAAVLGSVLVAKGTLAVVLPSWQRLRKAYLGLLEAYTAAPALWAAQSVVAVCVGIVLIAWGVRAG